MNKTITDDYIEFEEDGVCFRVADDYMVIKKNGLSIQLTYPILQAFMVELEKSSDQLETENQATIKRLFGN